MYTLAFDALDELVALLGRDGRTVLGPVLRDGTLTLGTITSAADLPRGTTVDPRPGAVRLRSRGDDATFGYVVGPDATKRWLYPPRAELWRAVPTDDGGFTIDAPPREQLGFAFLGLRACDLAALAIYDRVLLDGPYADPIYASRRADTLIVAVQCAEAAETCFCASMGAGPRVHAGYDLCLTEIVGSHFVVEVGSDAGQRLVDQLPVGPARPSDHDAPQHAAAAAAVQSRVLPNDIDARLARSLDAARYDDIASRCLGCSSCTMVCPTCFCTTTEATTTLDGEAVHARRWDSCFDPAFTDLHGHAVRDGVGVRYRQWITHKLSTWSAQFDTRGCVGCGRCIAWCPAGIDLVAEALALGSDHG